MKAVRGPVGLICALALFAMLPFVGGSATAAGSMGAAASETRPNILLIVSDDQAWSTFSRKLMPSVYGQLVDQGVLFRRAYVNTSLCCPSRAEILTGLYEHNTGVDANEVRAHPPHHRPGAARFRVSDVPRREVPEQLGDLRAPA